MRPDPAIELWDGETLDLGRGRDADPRRRALPRRDDPAPGRRLLTGDIIQVIPDRTHVAFMWSYPNLVPLPDAEVQRLAAAVARSRSTRSTARGGGR